jgi:hypothetical protein
VLTGLSSLPHTPSFQQENQRSNDILKALLYENVRFYEKANLIWKSLPEDNPEVQDHLFFTDLAAYLELQKTDIPKSEKSLLLMSRYLSWQRSWKQAVQILENDQQPSIEKKLELIRLDLVLGYYEKAGVLIDTLGPIDHRDKMQAEILKIWLQVLVGDKKNARIGIQSLEEDYLYLPLSTMFPDGYLGNETEQKSILVKSLVRFPSNKVLFEQLVKLLIKSESWQELDRLVHSQQFLGKTSFVWTLLAEIYLNTGQQDAIDDLLKSIPPQGASPEYFDIIARIAIDRKNWELLLKVSEILQSRFPYLMDGKLYLAIYYRETGELEKSRSLIEQAGL